MTSLFRPAADAISARPVRLVIADDHEVMRGALREWFADCPGLVVVGEASNGLQAIDQARALRPDVIVMDVSMPEMDGVEATRRIHAELPDVRIFCLSASQGTDTAKVMNAAGAVGCFAKGLDLPLLVESILSVPVLK
jgi:DNA-binding NarL/FixJ family response regulator